MVARGSGLLSGISGYQRMLQPGFIPRTVNRMAINLLPDGRIKRGLLAANDIATGQMGNDAVIGAANAVAGQAPAAQAAVAPVPQPTPPTGAPVVQGKPPMTLTDSRSGVGAATGPGGIQTPMMPPGLASGMSLRAGTGRQPVGRSLTQGETARAVEGAIRMPGNTPGVVGELLNTGWKAGLRPVLNDKSRISMVPEGEPGSVPVGTISGTSPMTEEYKDPASGKLDEDFINAATGRLQNAAAAGMGIRSGTNAYIGSNMTATGMTPEQQHLANLAKTDATKERMMRDTQTVGRIRGNTAAAEASRQFDETQKTARQTGLVGGMPPQYTKTEQGVWVDAQGKPAPTDVAGRLDAGEYEADLESRVAGLDPALETSGGIFSGPKQYGINRATGELEIVPVSELNKEDKKRTHDPLPAKVRSKMGTGRAGNFKTIEEVAAALGSGKIDRATAEKEYTRIKGAKK